MADPVRCVICYDPIRPDDDHAPDTRDPFGVVHVDCSIFGDPGDPTDDEDTRRPSHAEREAARITGRTHYGDRRDWDIV